MPKGIRQATMLAIEADIEDYPATRKAIREIEESIAYGSGQPAAVTAPDGSKVRPPGIRSNWPSDITAARASQLATHALLHEMRRTAAAIEQAIKEMPQDRRRWVALRYWQTPRLTNQEAAERAGISDRQARRWRRDLIERIAEILGRW